MAEADQGKDRGSPDTVRLWLNGATYAVRPGNIAVADLRQVPFPAISPDYDLWLEQPGGSDRQIRDGEVIQLVDEMKVYTAPRSIMAG